MTVGREVYKGFEASTYKTALDTAGYPADSVLPPGVQARRAVPKPVRKLVPAGGASDSAAAQAPQSAENPNATR